MNKTNETPKGLDDALKAGARITIHEGDDAQKAVEEILAASKASERDEALKSVNFVIHSVLVNEDAGAPFEPASVSAFVTLKILDQAEFFRARDKIKGKIKVKAFDAEIEKLESAISVKKTSSRIPPEAMLDLPDGVKLPRGYTVSKFGIERIKETEDGQQKTIKVSNEPVYIAARTENLDDGTKGVVLYMGVDGRIEKRIVPQRIIADANELLELANSGFPVTSINKNHVVEYLDEQLHASKRTLPSIRTTSKSGWIESEGCKSFVLGSQVICVLRDENKKLEFNATNPHAKALLRSTQPKGTLEKWLDAVAPLMRFKNFVFVLGAAFGSPLFEVLGVTNIIVHFQGESSKGKTTLMLAAASIYAFPGDSSSQNAFIKQWRGTDNAIESLAATHNGLILILDEAGQATEDTRKKIIYMLGNGQQKARANSTGDAKETKNFHLVLLSTGEVSLTSQATTGQEVRVIEVTSAPFAEDSSDLREMVDNFRSTIQGNYGTAGQLYLQTLVESVNDLSQKQVLLSSFQEKHDKLLAHQNSIFHARNAKAFAAMWSGFELANSLFTMIPLKDEIERIFTLLYQEAGEKWANAATTVEKAIKYVWDEIDANSARFCSPSSDREYNMLGLKTDTGGLTGCIAFYDTKLDELLIRGGFDPKSSKRAFKEKNYLVLASDGSNPQVRMGDGARSRLPVFHRSKVPHLYRDQTEGVYED